MSSKVKASTEQSHACFEYSSKNRRSHTDNLNNDKQDASVAIRWVFLNSKETLVSLASPV